jgi:hypothetical protein
MQRLLSLVDPTETRKRKCLPTKLGVRGEQLLKRFGTVYVVLGGSLDESWPDNKTNTTLLRLIEMAIKIERCYLPCLFDINEDHKENHFFIEFYLNNSTDFDLHTTHPCFVFQERDKKIVLQILDEYYPKFNRRLINVRIAATDVQEAYMYSTPSCSNFCVEYDERFLDRNNIYLFDYSMEYARVGGDEIGIAELVHYKIVVKDGHMILASEHDHSVLGSLIKLQESDLLALDSRFNKGHESIIKEYFPVYRNKAMYTALLYRINAPGVLSRHTTLAATVTVPKQVPDVPFLQWNTLKKRKIEMNKNEDWDKSTRDYFERIQDDASELWIEFVPIRE